HVQGVQRLDDRQTDRVAGGEELAGGTGHRVDLVAAPGEPLVPVPAAQELVAHGGGLGRVGRPGPRGTGRRRRDTGRADDAQAACGGQAEKQGASGGPGGAYLMVTHGWPLTDNVISEVRQYLSRPRRAGGRLGVAGVWHHPGAATEAQVDEAV